MKIQESDNNMIKIEIHNNENVKIVTNEKDFALFLDNKGNVKTKFQLEDSYILLLAKLPVLADITAFYT